MPITSRQLREQLEARNSDGFSTYTHPQIESDVEQNDSFLANKLQKARKLGINREQALNYFAYGDVRGNQEQKKKGFFEKITDGFGKAVDSVQRRGLEFAEQTQRIAGEDGKLGVSDIPELAFGLTTSTYGGLFEAGLHSGLGVASAITPDSIEKPVINVFSNGLKAAMEAPVIEDAMAAWDEFKQSSPRAAFNVGGAAEVAFDMAAGAAAAKVAKKGVKSAAKAGDDVSDVAKKVAKGAKNVAPTKTDIADNLINEALGFNSSQVRNLSQKHILNIDPVTWLRERGIIGTRETVLSQLDELADSAEDVVSDLVAQVPGRLVNDDSEKLLRILQKEILSADIRSEGGLREILEEVTDLSRFPEKTLAQHQRVKQLAGKYIRMYSNKTGTQLDNVVAGANRSTYGRLREFIETSAQKAGINDIGRFNKDVQGAIEISKALNHTGGLAPYARLIPLLKQGGRTGLATLAGFSFGGPIGGFAAFVIERLYEIPAVKVFFARRMVELPANELDEVLNALRTGQPNATASRFIHDTSDDLMRVLNQPGVERAAAFPESLSAKVIQDVNKTFDEAFSMVKENRISLDVNKVSQPVSFGESRLAGLDGVAETAAQ